ncbi:MAG TPA: response regulator [Burkholderiales bacterium]|nr:response regulator [Burkholderiales bacterium]
MPAANAFPTSDDDVYALTARGEAQIRSAETDLSPLALQLLVLVDGKSNLRAIRRHAVGASGAEVDDAIGDLLRDGMICPAVPVENDAIEFEMSGLVPAPDRGAGAISGETDSGLQSLREHGYYVRIARRPSSAPALPQGRKPVVIVVEDEVHLARFMRHFLTFEGFEVRTAANRAEIVEAFRQSPPPDLILLDVMLPDADGFEVLAKVRQYPALQTVPVIMITAKATREAVLKGLAGGADGYITKPFQPEALTTAIRTMFGLAQPVPSTDVWKNDDRGR